MASSWLTSIDFAVRAGPRSRVWASRCREDQDPVRQPRQLVTIGGDQHDGDALGGAPLDDLVDLGASTDVDTLGRVVEHQHLRVGAQRSRHEDAAAKASAIETTINICIPLAEI